MARAAKPMKPCKSYTQNNTACFHLVQCLHITVGHAGTSARASSNCAAFMRLCFVLFKALRKHALTSKNTSKHCATMAAAAQPLNSMALACMHMHARTQCVYHVHVAACSAASTCKLPSWTASAVPLARCSTASVYPSRSL